MGNPSLRLSEVLMKSVQAVRASLTCPHPPGYQSKIILLISTNFETTECEDVSIINISEVKFNCLLCRIVPHA